HMRTLDGTHLLGSESGLDVQPVGGFVIFPGSLFRRRPDRLQPFYRVGVHGHPRVAVHRLASLPDRVGQHVTGLLPRVARPPAPHPASAPPVNHELSPSLPNAGHYRPPFFAHRALMVSVMIRVLSSAGMPCHRRAPPRFPSATAAGFFRLAFRLI